ncbi:chloride channel protein [Saccharospirillum salsuginis]|uniref:Chloride channel protein n=1 Tax=Saccharospirillum salsuginis TaxID=418750 RepID=A0A918KA79_9GAMM|nr:chloride channel protein [Saccharospirillum salsuginis]GGX53816.1 chloride channel protein [Saccharospirillum salsuginis]
MPEFGFSRWRTWLKQSDGLFTLVLLGVVTGIATSAVMALFLSTLDAVLHLLNGESLEDFESLSAAMRFALPVVGSLLLILLFRFTPNHVQTVGVAHVLDRLRRGRGRLPAGNAIFQFVAALIALGSGHSVGKEGPAVHIGAGIANQLGQATHRVPSQLRLLTGCGTAAAISSAFDTPLAGVLFAMEVVLMEYSLLGFTPIIASAVTAAVTTRWFMGEHPAFVTDPFSVGGLADLPALLLTGLMIGLFAVVFHRLVRTFLRMRVHARALRLLLAGVIAGALALVVPQILGSGFDTVNAALANELGWTALLVILVAKIVATAAAIGLGVPAGLIGPTLVMGACAGGVIGALMPGAADPAFYALLGMAAMMSAVLHAPLAALAAVLELSLNAHAMFPAMVVVLGANLVCQHAFKQPSLFRALLEAQGLTIETHPVRIALSQRFLSELASSQFDRLDLTLDEDRIGKVLKGPYRWVMIQIENDSYLLSKPVLNEFYVDWVQLNADTRRPLGDALRQAVPPYSRLVQLDGDITLLGAVKLLKREDTAGFMLPLDDDRVGLVTRGQLVSVLTSEGDIH